MILQVFPQDVRLPPVPGEDHQAVALLQIVDDVPRGGGEAAPIAGQNLGRQVQQGPGGQRIGAAPEIVREDHRPVRQVIAELLPFPEIEGQAALQLVPLQKGLHVLPQLPTVVFGPLGAAAGLQHHHRRFRGQVAEAVGKFVVEQGDVLVRRGKAEPGGHMLQVGGEVADEDTGRGLAPAQLFDEGAELLAQEVRPAVGQTGEALRRRKDLRPLQVFRPPLGGRVEKAHAVDLIPEKLAAHRLGVGGGEEVQDAAPDGELPHALHGIAALIAAEGQLFRQQVQLRPVPHLQGEADALQLPGGKGALHEPVGGGHQQGRSPRQQLSEGPQPGMLPLAGDAVRPEEGEFPGKEGLGLLLAEGGQVGPETLRFQLVGADHQQGPPRFLADGGGGMGGVDAP